MRDLHFSHVTSSAPITVAASGTLWSMVRFAISYYALPSAYLFVYVAEPVWVGTHVQYSPALFPIRYSTLASVSLPTTCFYLFVSDARMAGPPNHSGGGGSLL